MRSALIVLLALPITACASASAVETTRTGAVPAQYATFVAEDAPSAATTAIVQALAERGWRAAAAAPLRIEGSYVERPEVVGGFQEADAPPDPERWRLPPGSRPWWRPERVIGILTVRAVEAATGREVAAASARTRRRGDPPTPSIESLARDAVGTLLAADSGVTPPEGE